MNINALNEDNLFFSRKVLEWVPNLQPRSLRGLHDLGKSDAVLPFKLAPLPPTPSPACPQPLSATVLPGVQDGTCSESQVGLAQMAPALYGP